MVLHNNKWDRKQNRDRVRKLKVKGKEDPANKDKHKVKEKEEDKLQKGSAPAEEGATDSDLDSDAEGSNVDEEAGTGEKKDGETENEENSVFSRRKVASNAWRYEEEEPEFPFDTTSTPPEEPEEDYVALTLAHKEQLKSTEEEDKAREGMIDEAFLNQSWGQQQKSKPKILKMDRKDFIDVTEKIAKQNNVSAFKARFEKNKTKSRAPKVSGADGDGKGGTGEDDDLDAFLGELNLDGGKPSLTGPILASNDWISQAWDGIQRSSVTTNNPGASQ
ncbi:hypothetical protein BDD12DRAFT_174980 [Trichophaea hybrida]|nr:hypothetical protein BDD12DRAFT_174980 [Trichophaea hybrida]